MNVGKIIRIALGFTKRDVEEKVEETQHAREARDREVDESLREEKRKRERGRRILAAVDITDMSEDDFVRLFNGGDEDGEGETGEDDS